MGNGMNTTSRQRTSNPNARREHSNKRFESFHHQVYKRVKHKAYWQVCTAI